MELYVHLPFCRRKCRYCDFPSWPGQEALMPRYTDALLREAAAWSDRLGHPPVETVFIGGGTPSTLPSALLSRLLGGLRGLFEIQPDAEFTSEANPGALTSDWLQAAVAGGVNRLSLGMQAAQLRLLRTLGRIHQPADVAEAVGLARAAGIRNLNLDLMFGLPGQTQADWRETLDAALALRPEHLSCYGLIPEEGTPLKADLDTGRLTLPDEADERAMYDLALTRLAENGYEQYEISNFARPGFACRHNLGYWRQVPYLGLGVAAASMLPIGEDCAYTRLTNPAALSDYLTMAESGNPALRTVEPISRREAMFETMMLGLRTTAGVSDADFERMHGVALDAVYGEKLRRIAADGLLRQADGRWALTRQGLDLQNTVLVALMD